MATFYDEFKFAVESCGFSAPTPEFFTTPMAALGAIAGAIGSLESLGKAVTSANLKDIAKGIPWLMTVIETSPSGTIIFKGCMSRMSPGALRGRVLINAAINAGGKVMLRGVVLTAFGCICAAYCGVLAGAVIYAIFNASDGVSVQSFFEWYYGVGATDAQTAAMQKKLMQKHEARRAQELEERSRKIALTGLYQPNLA